MIQLFGVVVTAGAGCADSGEPSASANWAPSAAVGAAIAKVQTLRSRFPSMLGPSTVDRFVVTEHSLRVFTTVRGALAITLPREAAGAVHLADEASGVAVAFALEGTIPVAATVADGVVFYAGAAPAGGDVIYRASPTGIEDFIAFARAPDAPTLRYRADMSHVAGLRLVENTLELLDDGGAPRVRVSSPFVVDADGQRIRATLSVEGCAVDLSPRAPWGRAVTRPGAASCVVIVSWPDHGVHYPALVDPAWGSGKNMLIERSLHALAPLASPSGLPCESGPILVTGGFDKNGTVLSSAEIYEPLSRTFAATGSMIKGRGGHTATPVPSSLSGHVFVAGGAGVVLDPVPPEKLGITSLVNSATTEMYDPQTGAFSLGPSMSVPRFYHTATPLPLPDGRILLTGGIFDLVNQPTKSADLFLFNSVQPLNSAIQPAAGQLQASRSGHAAALLANGDILITGGISSASFALLTGEIFCASGGCSPQSQDHFSVAPTQMTVPRAFHTATTLTSGDVLVVGGVNAVKNPNDPNTPIKYSDTAELFAGGAFQTPAVPMAVRRAFHTTTRATPPLVLVTSPGVSEPAEAIVVGGFDGETDLATAEAYFPASKAFHPLFDVVPPATVDMSTSRRHAVALFVNAGNSERVACGVLVTGGIANTMTVNGVLVAGHATKSAELLFKELGDPCVAGAECRSGFCAGGVCCDASCTQECWSCTAATKQDGSPDGTCGPTLLGASLPVHCVDNAETNEHDEVHNECDGSGKAHPGLSTHSCKPSICDAGGVFCSTICSALQQCAVTGWCDLSSPPDGGAPDAGGSFGTCQDKKDNGAVCGANEQCKFDHCVDGVCCDLPCSDQCQACNLAGFAGKCLQVGAIEVHAQPHPNSSGDQPRAMCAGQGTTCMGWCGITSGPTCEYPDAATALRAADCTNHDDGKSTTIHYPCDGLGSSSTVPGDCAGFRCDDDHQCKVSCKDDDDCSLDHVCVPADAGAKTCQPLTGPLCDGIFTLRNPSTVEVDQDCRPYACPDGHTKCLLSCASIQECIFPFVCDGNRCVPRPEAPPLASCSVGSGPAGGREGGQGIVLALSALVLLAARRGR